MPDWPAVIDGINAAGGSVSHNAKPVPVSGGDISAAWRLGDVFLKTGPASVLDMFSAEADGLREIAATKTLRVPEVLACGTSASSSYIAMEWIDFDHPDAATEHRLGERLAAMHAAVAERFGWHRDNTIGLTPQPNPWTSDWVEFLRDQRLGHQFRLAADKGYSGQLQALGARLLKRLPVYFGNPEASLLHGDLWGGNWASCRGTPVVFDPAVYYGDRESDLAMTRLFGGFGREFYTAYEASWPLSEGWQERVNIYQLYHVLNHLNLFGRAYLERALTLLEQLR